MPSCNGPEPAVQHLPRWQRQRRHSYSRRPSSTALGPGSRHTSCAQMARLSSRTSRQMLPVNSSSSTTTRPRPRPLYRARPSYSKAHPHRHMHHPMRSYALTDALKDAPRAPPSSRHRPPPSLSCTLSGPKTSSRHLLRLHHLVLRGALSGNPSHPFPHSLSSTRRCFVVLHSQHGQTSALANPSPMASGRMECLKTLRLSSCPVISRTRTVFPWNEVVPINACLISGCRMQRLHLYVFKRDI